MFDILNTRETIMVHLRINLETNAFNGHLCVCLETNIVTTVIRLHKIPSIFSAREHIVFETPVQLLNHYPNSTIC